MLCNFILYIIVFHIKFFLIINKNNKIVNNDLANTYRVFKQFIISNILKLIININRTKIHYYFFFKNSLNKFILGNKVEEIRFSDIWYKKKNLSSWNKKLENRR